MVNIVTGKNIYKRNNSPETIAAYHHFADGQEPVIFLKYGICDCKAKLFDMGHLVHALEHEFVELACRDIVDFTKTVTAGFDKMSFKWHSFKFPHTCDLVEYITYG